MVSAHVEFRKKKDMSVCRWIIMSRARHYEESSSLCLNAVIEKMNAERSALHSFGTPDISAGYVLDLN